MSNAPLALTVPVALVLLIVAVMAAVTARRGWTGSLRRDGKLGIHSPAAASSDASFRAANKVAAPVVAGAAVVAVLFAVLVLVLPVPVAATVVIAVLGLIAVPLLLISAGVMGERVARTMPVPARRPVAGPACDGCACGSGGCAGLTRTAVPVDAVPASLTEGS